MIFKNARKDNVQYKLGFRFKSKYEYLTENNLLYCKQFGFQKRHSPKHAVLLVVEQINQSFEKNKFTHGIFLFIQSFRHS